MTVTYLKEASINVLEDDINTKKIVSDMLKNIEKGGEDEVIRYSQQFDNHTSNIVLTKEQIQQASNFVSDQLKYDIDFAIERIKKFALEQRKSINEFEIELSPGLITGQKLVPIETAGCYIPGGRYAHIASAIMSIITAKVAGVSNIIAASAAHSDTNHTDWIGPHPAIVYTANKCGADIILTLGGVQVIASLAHGYFTNKKANILVGPGNKFVAEAKRMFFGQVAIDMVAGPTEIAIIADDDAESKIITQDLVSQIEHGPESPGWLITTSSRLAKEVLSLIDGYIQALPDDTPSRKAATMAWRDYGEVIVCDTVEEAVKISDMLAAEHLELHCNDNNIEYYFKTLKNYGSLFIGEHTTVTYGDKCSGPNHILPTRKAASYTGGLSVHKFLKVVTYQKMSKEANWEVGQASARISRYEGMEGHARAADARINKYFPNSTPKLK